MATVPTPENWHGPAFARRRRVSRR